MIHTSTTEMIEKLKQKIHDGTISENESWQYANLVFLQQAEDEKKIRDTLLDAICLTMLKTLDKMK